jgi:hypothetical protein
MAYEDWMPEFQEIWEDLPVGELSQNEYEMAEYFFEEGFMTYSGEAPPSDIQFAREEFWDLIGEEWEDYFDWEAWREAMYPE